MVALPYIVFATAIIAWFCEKLAAKCRDSGNNFQTHETGLVPVCFCSIFMCFSSVVSYRVHIVRNAECLNNPYIVETLSFKTTTQAEWVTRNTFFIPGMIISRQVSNPRCDFKLSPKIKFRKQAKILIKYCLLQHLYIASDFNRKKTI